MLDEKRANIAKEEGIMSILSFLKKIKLPSCEDDFIVDPVDRIHPEYGRQMGLLAAMHRGERTKLATKDDDWGFGEEEDDSDATLPGTSAYFTEHNLS